MRLWHQSLIPLLPRQQLLGQHREICALRGKGWGRKHATVDYAFKYPPAFLVAYHMVVMQEMVRRGYHPDSIWTNPCWRGGTLGEESGWADPDAVSDILEERFPIYPEHNAEYLQECVDNLKQKGIVVFL